MIQNSTLDWRVLEFLQPSYCLCDRAAFPWLCRSSVWKSIAMVILISHLLTSFGNRWTISQSQCKFSGTIFFRNWAEAIAMYWSMYYRARDPNYKQPIEQTVQTFIPCLWKHWIKLSLHLLHNSKINIYLHFLSHIGSAKVLES